MCLDPRTQRTHDRMGKIGSDIQVPLKKIEYS